MYCIKCGRKLKEFDNYCDHCGKRISGSEIKNKETGKIDLPRSGFTKEFNFKKQFLFWFIPSGLILLDIFYLTSSNIFISLVCSIIIGGIFAFLIIQIRRENYMPKQKKIINQIPTYRENRTATSLSKPIIKKSWLDSQAVRTTLIVLGVGVVLIFRFGDFLNNDAAISDLNSGNSSQAISHLQQASEGAITNDTKINTLKNLAYAYSTEGKNDLSLKTFKEALALASNDSFDYYLISGEIGLLERKPDLALSNYNKAYQINPNNFQINNALNLFYIDLDESAKSYANYPKALGYAQKAYEVSEASVKNIAKQNLAISYLFNKKYEQAITLFLSADLAKEPYANYWLGVTYVAKGDSANAKIYLKKAKDAGIKLEPELSEYLY